MDFQLRTKRIQIALALSLPLQWIGFKLLSAFPTFVEQFYSNGLYQFISKTINSLFFWIPFSVGQFVFYLLLFGLIKLLIKQYRTYPLFPKPSFKLIANFLLKPTAYLSIIYLLFICLWGINYNRDSLQTTLQFEDEAIEKEDLKALAEALIKETINSRSELTEIDDSALNLDLKNKEYFNLAKDAYERLGDEIYQFKIKRPSVKAVAFPQLMSLFGIGGIYFPFTGEANVNMHQPDFKLPFTICHEMAHQAGFASETEANFIAYLACKKSDNALFNYSGSFSAMRHVLNALHKADTSIFNQTIVKLSKGILLDLEANTIYWEKFETPIDDFSRWMNNLFLKANGQTAGIDSYGLVVELLVADYKKSTKPKPRIVSKPKVEAKPKAAINANLVDQLDSLLKIELPFAFNEKILKSFDTNSMVTLKNGSFLLALLKKNDGKAWVLIKDDLKNEYSICTLLESGEILQTYSIYNLGALYGKINMLNGSINSNLEIEKTLSVVQCQKINDSLTVCDTTVSNDLIKITQ